VKRIYDGLARAFDRNRVIFWYDGAGEWTDTFEGYAADGVVKLRIANNEFAAKVRVIRQPDTRFLLYVPGPKPNDADNWLLDLLLQGHEFRADKAALGAEEAGLPQEYWHLATDHSAFFNSTKRIAALRELVTAEDQVRDVRLKLMSVLAGTQADLDTMLRHFLARGINGASADPVAETLAAAALAEPFWREVDHRFGYAAAVPSIRDFAVTLFRAMNPLDTRHSLRPHASVFVRNWKDSLTHQQSYREWASALEQTLQVEASLAAVDERTTLGENDTFEIFERFTLHRLAETFERETPTSDLRTGIQERRASFWRTAHADGYNALEHAVALRELIAAADLHVESMGTGARRYAATWWQIDREYRLAIHHLRRYGQTKVMEPVREWVEKHYVNDFVLPLAERWGDQVARLERWECDGIPAQRRFFETYVQPFRAKGQKVFVIISDALRYEAAADFTQRLGQANRWSTEIEPMLSALPSYTQLGMASLLPGREWSVDAETGYASVDSRSAVGTPNRAEILAAACDGRATALQAEHFLAMNSKTDGRDLMRDHDVIYIYHNKIDHIGDKTTTEHQTTDAVAEAFVELEAIIKKVANINGTNMLLTADHGFLFQQTAVEEDDMIYLPTATKWGCTGRRYGLGWGVRHVAGVKTFNAAELGVGGDWTAAFPLALGRFLVRGSGNRYVHGGISLQEVIVPVVKIRKTRTDDVAVVAVDFLRVPTKITTGQLSITVYQDQAVAEKVRPRTLRIGVYAKDGTPLSEVKTIAFDSKEQEARLRETAVLLVLSGAADTQNNKTVDLRLDEMVQGTSHWVTYRSHELKIQKAFTSDFDDF
jgi:uncharacterized protein (TIGR02687 family)